jgi:quercetin dioxygenase-like cupin family protein
MPEPERQGRTPRVSYAAPTRVRAGEARRHRWGDDASGYVEDEVIISSGLLHAIIFELPRGGSFVHSRENPTIFGADIVYVVLSGVLLLADPEHGQLAEAGTGDALFFRRDTWHDGFDRGHERLRVLEFFAPPPATGTSSAYAREQPYLQHARYGNDDAIGGWPERADVLRASQRIHLLRPRDRLLRLEGDVLWSIIASTEHLHVASGRLSAGRAGPARRYGGDAALYLTGGHLRVETIWGEDKSEHLLAPGDTLIAPEGTTMGLRASDASDADFLLGVAPSYFADGVPV